MLPSFRLIAATFLCSFFIVFAGLRLAASLNDMHEALPVMAAQAAPVSIAPAADREMRRGLSSVPVMYDLRFAVSTLAPTLVRVAPPILDRPVFPRAILPPQDAAQESSATLGAGPANDVAPTEKAVAAIEPETPAVQPPYVIPDAPAEPPTPKSPVLAAIDSQAKPEATANWPAAETPAPEAQSVEAKTAAIDPQAAPSPATEEPLTPSEPAAEAPDTPDALSDPAAASPEVATIPEGTPEIATSQTAMPAPKARAAKPSHRAKAKAKIVRKKRIRTAHRLAPASPFGSSSSNPFGVQRP
jgi:hypothetical protein